MSDESTPFSAYRRAKDLLEEGKPEEAEALLREVVESEPQFTDARFLFARCQARLGRYGRAANLCRDLTKALPDDMEVLDLYAKCLEALERRRALRKVYERMLDLDPGREEILVTLAMTHCDDGKFGHGVSVLRRGVRRLGQRPALLHAIGECYLRGGKIGKAEEAFRAAVAADPGHEQARKALEHLGIGGFPSVRPQAGPAPAEQGDGAPSLERIGEWLEAGELERAREALAARIQGGDGSREARLLLVRCAALLGGDPDAKALAEQLLGEHEDAEALFLLGLLCSQGGEKKTALECLSRAIALDPRHLEAICQKALVERSLGLVRESAETFETARQAV